MPQLVKNAIRRFLLSLLLFLALSATSFCQEGKSIEKSWIKRDVYDLSANQKINDTLYTRYTFSKRSVYLCFYPGWNDNEQSWSLSGDQLVVGVSTYTIESLTDSTLTIFIPGFRRIVLDDEHYLNQRVTTSPVVDTIDNDPVYTATRLIMPRYKGLEFRKTIEQNLAGYNIRRAITFSASFIVKKDGTVDKVQVVKGITEGFDAEVCKQLKKTSKKWSPALYNGQPVAT